MSELSEIAHRQAHFAGRQELQDGAAAVQDAAAAARQRAVVESNLATVGQLRIWGEALEVHNVFAEVAKRVGELGVTIAGHKLVPNHPHLAVHEALWMPHGPASGSWDAAATASFMPVETRGMRVWRVAIDDHQELPLPQALVLLYQEQGEFAVEAPRLAVVNPAMTVGGDATRREDLQQALLDESIGRRSTLLRQALELDETLAAYVQGRGRTTPPDQLTPEQTDQIERMYYAAQLFDSGAVLSLNWKELEVTEAIIARQYHRAAELLQVNMYNRRGNEYEYAYNANSGRLLGRLLETKWPLNPAAHLKNLGSLHWALTNAKEKGYIARSGIEQGPSLFAYSISAPPKPMPQESDQQGVARADVAETARHLPELQAMLAAPRTKKFKRLGLIPVRREVAGGVIGRNSVPVLLEGEAGIGVARSQLQAMLDSYFARQWIARQTGRRPHQS